MLSLYRWLTPLGWLLLMTVGRLLPKVRENIAARAGWARGLARLRQERGPGWRPVWIHCASMGEFEAIRPLARLLKAEGLPVALSFFSTSGPRHLGDGVEEADWVGYLPFDTPWAARRFVKLLAPRVALVTKHDLWPCHILATRRAGVPQLFVNANFHPRSRLASPWLRGFHRQILACFDWIGAVGPEMARRFEELLEGLSVPVEVAGDSRFDRVVERARSNQARELLPAGLADGLLVVAGSSWEPDEELLLPAFAALRAEHPGLGLSLLLVPHEPTPAQLERIESRLGGLDLPVQRLGALEAGEAWRGGPVLLVDRVGLLAGLYGGARLAWVGGGFTSGVHSVIEPAASGLPVLFGPRHHVSQEAQDLLACGGAREVADAGQARAALARWLLDPAAHQAASRAAAGLVERRTGASRLLRDRVLAVVRPS